MKNAIGIVSNRDHSHCFINLEVDNSHWQFVALHSLNQQAEKEVNGQRNLSELLTVNWLNYNR